MNIEFKGCRRTVLVSVLRDRGIPPKLIHIEFKGCRRTVLVSVWRDRGIPPKLIHIEFKGCRRTVLVSVWRDRGIPPKLIHIEFKGCWRTVLVSVWRDRGIPPKLIHIEIKGCRRTVLVSVWRDRGIPPKLIHIARLQADISMRELPNLQHKCYTLSQNSRCWQRCSYPFSLSWELSRCCRDGKERMRSCHSTCSALLLRSPAARLPWSSGTHSHGKPRRYVGGPWTLLRSF